MRFLKKFIKSINSSKILAVCFLAFCCFTGLGAFAPFLTNTADAIENSSTLAEYIEVIDEQYSGMLTTEQDNEFFHNKATYINFNGLMGKALDQTMVNDRFKLKNGSLAAFSKNLQFDQLDLVFENIQRLYQNQNDQGKSFLFVLAPSNMYQQETLLPTGYHDSSNERINYLLDLLKANNIPCLDLREEMYNDEIENSEAFFVTDHHWTPQTGFWAYTKILGKLSDLGAISPVNDSYTNTDNFSFTVFEDSFLGSSGKRTGRFFAGVDDFCVISPNFDTSISATVESAGINLQGRWEEVAYKGGSMEQFLLNPDYFNDNPYGRYGQGDRDLTQWRNESAPEDKRFLLIGDSFGNVPFSLMPLYISSCDEVDMRYFKGDFTAYYESYDPDTVVLLVNVNSSLTENTLYPFLSDISN